MKNNRVFVLGGTGFVGQHLLYRLSRAGIFCRVPTRHPERHRQLRLIPGCELCAISGWETAQLAAAMAGCSTLINLAGILNEVGGRTFDQTHVKLVETAIHAAIQAGVTRYLHLSALGANAESGLSDYLRSKGRGEALAFAAARQGLAVTSFRPSVIFGPGDSFFNRFARLLRLLPGPFPLACPNARFAPVYVGDVADAMLRCLDDPDTHGQIYELCGPRAFTLRELVIYAGERIGREAWVIDLNDRLSQLQAQLFQRLPGKPFTLDNYLTLQVESVCQHAGLKALGIVATAIDDIVPDYLA